MFQKTVMSYAGSSNNFMKKIFNFYVFGFVVVFLFANFIFPVTAFAARNASVEISPTEAFTNKNLTYTYKIINTNDETTTAGIGSIEIQIPDGFGIPSISIASISDGKTWKLSSEGDYVDGFDSSNNKIGIQANTGEDKLTNTEFIEISIQTTASNTLGVYEFTGFVWSNIGFSGSPVFTIENQSTVEVLEEIIPEPTPTVNFIIRNGETIVFNNSVGLPDEGTVSINDSNDVAHDVDARSVLAILDSIDESNENFSISNLEYYEAYSSFYLKCILPEGGIDACDNWQYAVGATTPFTSIDTTVLSGGETVGIYFGSPHQVILSTSSLNTNESLIATAEKYDYENNTWNPLTGVNIGVTLPDLENPWSPIVVDTYTVDDLGMATITFENANTYYLGIAEDYYFPTYTVTVSTVPSNEEENNGGGGSGGGGSQVLTFSVPNAISYLQGVQGTDGSFGSNVLYSDWVAIAYGSYNVSGGSKSSLLSYMKNNNSISSLLTDNERRAMAILALGENPYSFNGVNYIEAIINKFDGNQFGDESLVNDDIFALIPLKKSGYGTSDEIISKSLDFIISKQKSNGSWENSIDITAAGIQALSMYKNYSGVNSAIENAKTYLKNSQVSDGGFGSVYASAWASQAMSAVSENWTNGGKSINDYFASQQINDGAVLPTTDTLSNRIWSTSYAVPAVLGKSWSDILVSVNKPSEGNLLNDAVNNDDISNEEVLILNTEIDEKEVSRLVSEIKNMIAQEEARTKNTKAIANNINTNEAQNDTKEKIKDLVSEVELQSLSANAAESKKKIPVAVVITSAGVLVIAGFFVRRFIF